MPLAALVLVPLIWGLTANHSAGRGSISVHEYEVCLKQGGGPHCRVKGCLLHEKGKAPGPRTYAFAPMEDGETTYDPSEVETISVRSPRALRGTIAGK